MKGAVYTLRPSSTPTVHIPGVAPDRARSPSEFGPYRAHSRRPSVMLCTNTFPNESLPCTQTDRTRARRVVFRDEKRTAAAPRKAMRRHPWKQPQAAPDARMGTEPDTPTCPLAALRAQPGCAAKIPDGQPISKNALAKRGHHLPHRSYQLHRTKGKAPSFPYPNSPRFAAELRTETTGPPLQLTG